MQELVSIIVVAYNSENTILDTLNSIYSQTWMNLELLVSDDCSNDNTVEVVKDWLKGHSSRFKYTQVIEDTSNKGIPANINKALRLVKGEYIQLIAGDDMFLPDGIERRMGYVRKYPDDIIYTQVNFIGQDGKRQGEAYQNYFDKMNALSRRRQFRELIRNDYILPLCIGPINRNVYSKIGLYDERYKLDEDWIFFLKLMLHGYTIRSFSDITAEYRLSDSSVCHGLSTAFVKCEKKLFREIRMPLMIRTGMFYDIICSSLGYVWQDIQIKCGKDSLKYKLFGAFMSIVNPKLFFIWIRSKFGRVN